MHFSLDLHPLSRDTARNALRSALILASEELDRRFRLVIVIGLAMSYPTPAHAQRTPHAATTLTPELVTRTVDSLGALLLALYPSRDTGATIAAHMRARLAAGAYADVVDAPRFALLLTHDLQTVNGDTHLVVDVAAGEAGAPSATAAIHGVDRVEVLAGNIGYLRMHDFMGAQSAAQGIVSALRMLAHCDAILVDLRNARGGSPDLANLLISHFTGARPVHSLSVYDRASGVRTERYTRSHVPGPRRPDVPLYLLIDDVTRSAAEDVPFVLQNMRRATLVGTRTAGAGRNNMLVPLGAGLVASISFTRVSEPGTGREWERVGVRPDSVTTSAAALPVAHELALQWLVAHASNVAARRELAAVAETVRAAGAAALATLDAQYSADRTMRLRAFVGTYEGGQMVSIEGDHLVYQPRVAQPRVALVPFTARGANAFGAGDMRYAFDVEGETARLRVTSADGVESTYARTGLLVPSAR